MERTTLSGPLKPGWDVELYRGDANSDSLNGIFYFLWLVLSVRSCKRI